MKQILVKNPLFPCPVKNLTVFPPKLLWYSFLVLYSVLLEELFYSFFETAFMFLQDSNIICILFFPGVLPSPTGVSWKL